MANTIRIKRRPLSGSAGAPSSASLYNGELAFNENDNTLYYAYGSGVGGISTAVPAIAGSGAYALRGGTNATGTWPISISGNSAYTTNAVYTTGTQTINGSKTFGNTTAFNSGIRVNGQIQGDPNINISNLTISSTDGASITINDNLSFSASNTAFNYYGGINGESVVFNDSDTGLNVLRVSDNVSIKAPAGASSGSYFPVWVSNPSGDAKAIYSRTPAQLLGDIGGYASSNPNGYTTNVGTVTSVVALTLGTTGTDVSSTVATSTTTPVITLNIPTASASNRGALNSTDWTTFNNKAAANQTMFIGTTSVAINRSSASLLLAGTSIDGNAGTVTSGVYTSGSYSDPAWISSLAKSKVGLSNVTNDAQVKKLASSTNGSIPIWNGTTGDALSDGYSVQTTLSSSSTAIPRADAVITYVDSLLAANDAMIFKGTLGSGGTITALPATAVNAGWTYRVITAATYAGIACEIGDLVIAIADALGNINSTWTVVQTNIDGAVVGPASSTTNALAVFNGTTGKLIQNSSFVPTTVGGNLINLTNPSAITFPKINADNTITTRSASELKTDLSLNNVENTALSTWAGSSNITTLGTIGTGTWNATTIGVNKGGTGQTSYVNGELLIGNSTGNTLTKATLTQGTGIAITNGTGSISIAHASTSSLTGAQGSNGIASITVDGLGHVTAVTSATYLSAGTVCAAIVDCSLDGGTF